MEGKIKTFQIEKEIYKYYYSAIIVFKVTKNIHSEQDT